MEPELQQVLVRFTALKLQGLNNQCADCALKNEVTWVSFNNAVFLCQLCAKLHQELFSKDDSDIRMIPKVVEPEENIDSSLSIEEMINQKIERQMLEEFNQTIIIEQQWDHVQNLEVLERGGNQKFTIFMKTWFGEQDKVKFSVLDSDEKEISFKKQIQEKYTSQSCRYYRQTILKSEQVQNTITPLGDDWCEINKEDLLFEEEAKEEAKESSIKFFGNLRSTLVGTQNSLRILPHTPKPNFQNGIKKQIFGFAGKIKEKFQKQPDNDKEDPYMRQLSGEYENPQINNSQNSQSCHSSTEEENYEEYQQYQQFKRFQQLQKKFSKIIPSGKIKNPNAPKFSDSENFETENSQEDFNVYLQDDADKIDHHDEFSKSSFSLKKRNLTNSRIKQKTILTDSEEEIKHLKKSKVPEMNKLASVDQPNPQDLARKYSEQESPDNILQLAFSPTSEKDLQASYKDTKNNSHIQNQTQKIKILNKAKEEALKTVVEAQPYQEPESEGETPCPPDQDPQTSEVSEDPSEEQDKEDPYDNPYGYTPDIESGIE